MQYSIKLNKKRHNIKVTNINRNIVLRHTGHRGPEGPEGLQGDPGVGVPAGGLDGQILQKASNADYDFEWQTPVYGDLTFTQDFIVTNEVTVNHNLNKYPSVTVFDSTGDEVEGEVNYISLDQLLVRFAAPFSGKVICN